jgi:3alpha(or 20beta)-hydroxysteroid dehydrogenase
MNGRLAGKIAIVTGGARGQGASHARAMVGEGAKVVLTDLRAELGEQLAAELGDAAKFIQHDVSKPEDWERVIATTEAAFGPVSVLVNNAGIAVIKPFDDMTFEEYQHVISINQSSVFLGMKAVIPSMRRASGGSIVNISSIAASRSVPGSMAYSAAKSAVLGMTRVAALEFVKDNIRVNAILPGLTWTPMISDVDDDTVAKLNEGVPMKRMATAAEVSNLVLYLASDESSYSTGSNFVVDGGVLARR